jgi:type I restriction enzyme M protein
MNLAIRGIDAQIAHGDTFHNDKHSDLKADWVMANPLLTTAIGGGNY